MIDFALPSDKEEIREIWDIAFPEDTAFNDWFFKYKFRSEFTIVYRENGVICSMLQALPYEISGFGKVSYIYGAATRPQFRRRGFMEKLLRFTHENDRKRGFEGSILIPANEGLFGYYGKMGYKTAFYVSQTTYKGVSNNSFTLKRADNGDIPFMNSIYVKEQGENLVVRTPDRWQEQLRLYNEIYGGAFVLLKEGVKKAYCFYTGENMVEIFGEEKAVLCGLVRGSMVTECTEAGENIPYGMLCSYNKKMDENMYIGLMFD